MEKLVKLTLLIGTLSLSSCGLHGNVMDSLFASGEEVSTSEKLFYPKRSSSEEDTAPRSAPNYDKVDIDLTNYSDTMAYTEAIYIGDNYDEYRGKTMKIKGAFSVANSTVEGEYFYECLVGLDSTGCCSCPFEFVLRENKRYPDDFPEMGAVFTVAGIFDPYTEVNEGKTYLYCNLSDAVIL